MTDAPSLTEENHMLGKTQSTGYSLIVECSAKPTLSTRTRCNRETTHTHTHTCRPRPCCLCTLQTIPSPLSIFPLFSAKFFPPRLYQTCCFTSAASTPYPLPSPLLHPKSRLLYLRRRWSRCLKNVLNFRSKKRFKYANSLWPHFRKSIMWLLAFSEEN